MSDSLDEDYLEWLYQQTGAVDNRDTSQTYWSLIKQLHSKPFTWFVPNDDNRAADGKDLRYEFIDEFRVDVDDLWMDLECSVLEMLIALARRVAFQSYGSPDGWFWHIIENLRLRQYTDRMYSQEVEDRVDHILDKLLSRRYTRNGSGGLFPLHNPTEDQRDVEIGYQMSAYLLKEGYVDTG